MSRVPGVCTTSVRHDQSCSASDIQSLRCVPTDFQFFHRVNLVALHLHPKRFGYQRPEGQEVLDMHSVEVGPDVGDAAAGTMMQCSSYSGKTYGQCSSFQALPAS
jgi:hypothetical protein